MKITTLLFVFLCASWAHAQGCSSTANIVPPTLAPFSGLTGAGTVVSDPEPVSGGNSSSCFHNAIARISDANTSYNLCIAQGGNSTSCATQHNQSEFGDNSDGEDNNWSPDSQQFVSVNSGGSYHVFNFDPASMASTPCFTTTLGAGGWNLNPTYSHVTPKLVYTMANAAGTASGSILKSFSLTGSCPLSPSGVSVYDFAAPANLLPNNTSACSVSGAPTAGCNGIGAMPFFTNAANTGAQTVTIDPMPAAVSTVSIKSALYSGATTRVMAEYQPWFCNTASPCNTHQNIGMEESTAAQALAQLQWMKSTGADVVDIDYYGCGASCGQGTTHAYELSVTNAIASAIAANPSLTPKLVIMLDEGAIWGSGTGQCPAGGGDQSACLIAAIEAQVDYMEKTWLTQSYYELNATNSHPIVMYFINPGFWPGTSFSTVYGAVATHATSGNSCGTGCTYSATVDFLDQDSGAFSETGIAGGFAWPQPNAWSSTQQFCYQGASSGCTFNYLADFYSHARAASSKIAVGVLYKGFDDNNASWGTDRVIAQQCGQVLGFTAAAIGTAGYSSSSQLQYVQLATWNDHEEGTEVETGIDNCITLTAPTISSGTISWSLVKSDATYASTSTIGSFEIDTGTTGPTTPYASGISATATSYSPAPTLSPGENLWVRMIGKPLIQNRLSPGMNGLQTFSGFANTQNAASGSCTSNCAILISGSAPSDISSVTLSGVHYGATFISSTLLQLNAAPGTQTNVPWLMEWHETDGISCGSGDATCGTGFSHSGSQNTAREACFYTAGSGVSCLNTLTGIVSGDYGTTGPALCMDCSGTPGIGTFPIHNVKLSPDGQWASVAIGGSPGCDITSTCYTPGDSPYFWQKGTTNVYSRCPVSTSFCGGHGILGVAGYSSQYSTPYWGFNAFTSSSVTEFPTAGSYCGTIVTPFDNHPTWWNNKGADQEPFFTSTSANSSNPTYSFCMSGEIYAIYTPSNAAKSGTYLRYAHNFCAATSQFAVQNCLITISPDGQFATLTTPMANTSTFVGQLGDTSGGYPCTVQANCRGDLFVVRLNQQQQTVAPAQVMFAETPWQHWQHPDFSEQFFGFVR
jgi:hypothetical protein